MPAPTNLSALTATQIGPSASVTQRVDDSGTTYTVWYQITPVVDLPLLGVWAFGDLTTYEPTLKVFTGPASAPTPYLIGVITGPVAKNVPVQFPVSAGVTYYLEIVTNSGNPSPANLTLSTRIFTGGDYPSGSILINDDSIGFPGVVMSSTANDSPLATVGGMPVGETMDVLADGTVAVSGNDGLSATDVAVYAPDLSTSVIYTSPLDADQIRQGNGLFWIAQSFGTHPSLISMSKTGVFGGTTFSLTGSSSGIGGLAIAPDASIAYYVASGGSASNAPVKRWNLNTNSALSDLAAGVAATITSRLLCLSDGSVVATYLSDPITAKRYSAAGATLNTYTFPGSVGVDARIFSAADDPNSFWVWTKATTNIDTLWNIKASDGSVIAQRTGIEYESGVYKGDATGTPIAFFGHSESCDAVVLRSAGTQRFPPSPPAGAVFIGTRVTLPMVRVRQVGIPPLSGNVAQFLGRVEGQFAVGIGVPDDPTANPKVSLKASGDNGSTFGTERLMGLGRTGSYYTRAYVPTIGGGPDMRFPVLNLRCSDNVNFTLTDLFVTREAGNG